MQRNPAEMVRRQVRVTLHRPPCPASTFWNIIIFIIIVQLTIMCLFYSLAQNENLPPTQFRVEVETVVRCVTFGFIRYPRRVVGI